jgi:hypothetical protein
MNPTVPAPTLITPTTSPAARAKPTHGFGDQMLGAVEHQLPSLIGCSDARTLELAPSRAVGYGLLIITGLPRGSELTTLVWCY